MDENESTLRIQEPPHWVRPLDKETIVNLTEKDLQRKEADRLLDELIEDSEFKEMLIKKIEKITDLKKQSTSAEVVALQSKR